MVLYISSWSFMVFKLVQAGLQIGVVGVDFGLATNQLACCKNSLRKEYDLVFSSSCVEVWFRCNKNALCIYEILIMLFIFCTQAIWCSLKCEWERSTDCLKRGRPMWMCEVSVGENILFCNNLTDTEQVHKQEEVSDLIGTAHVQLFLQQWALQAVWTLGK